MDVSTAVNAVKTILDVRKAIESAQKPSPSKDPRVRRWRELVGAHNLDPFTALVRLGAMDVSPMVAIEDESLARALNGDVLRASARMFNVRFHWLLGLDDGRYDLMTLDESFTPLLRDLTEWQREGTHHAVAAFKTGRRELHEAPNQFGALVLLRQADDNDEHPTYAFRPVYSLATWRESKQRWLAMRTVWAAWYMGFVVRGYEASERHCEGIREGRVFPVSARRDWGVGKWHPDDYVVRPSESAKGEDSLAAALRSNHAEELSTSVAKKSHRLRRLS